jgi:SAM-dependent methyltransferase
MEERHFWHIGRREIIGSLLSRYAGDARHVPRMVEIGCGNGSVMRFLEWHGIDVTGIDLYREPLVFSAQRSRAPVYQADAYHTPFPDGGFDVVGAFDVLEHLDDDFAALREMHRICAPGGIVLLTVPAHGWLWSRFDTLSNHRRRYRRPELLGLLRRAGFSPIRSTYFMFFLLPFLVLARIPGHLCGRSQTAADLHSDLGARTIPLVNPLLLAIMRIERALLAAFPLPTGSSLIAIARKPP